MLRFLNSKTLQYEVREITQHSLFPFQVPGASGARSRLYLNTELPFEDVLVTFNQIVAAINSKTQETSKSDSFLP